jgi:hypothetical protein
MKLLMYFASFGSVLVFFASAIGGRFFRALIFPPNIPKRREHVSIDLHSHHLKRAGQ